MLYRWGTFIYRLRWFVVAAWVVLLLIALPLGAKATSELSNGFGRTDTEAQRGLDILNEALGLKGSSFIVVFRSEDKTHTESAFRSEVERVLGTLMSSENLVTSVVTPYNSGNPNMSSPDGHTIYTIAYVDAPLDETMNMVDQLRGHLHSAILQVWTTGGIPIFYDINVVSEEDLRRAETIAFPVILIVLIVVFGSVVAAGLPVIMGAMSVLVTSALIYLLAQFVDMSIFVLNIATLLGLGVAIDYSLLVVNRFREELDIRDVSDALGVTISTAGRAILFSAITSILGLSGLLFFDFMMLRSLGVGGVTVMLLSLSVAFTLLPAAIGILGHRVSSLRLLPVRNVRGEFWRHLASWVMKYPVVVVIPLVGFLLMLGTPFLNANIGAPWASILPPDVESREGSDILSQEIGPGETIPILVVYTSPNNILSSENITAMHKLAEELVHDPTVDRVESIVTIDPSLNLQNYQDMYTDLSKLNNTQILAVLEEMTEGNTAFMRVIPRDEIMEETTKGLVTGIRSFSDRGDMTVYVTGGTADLMDSIEMMYDSFPFVILYVLATVYIALFLLFRSVVLPLKAVLMNSMSIFATYGAIVFIFQDGHFENLLGFSAMGYTDAVMPIVLFCIIFGLSMDYEVFLLSRVKEIYDETGDNIASVSLGLQRTGRIITSAALVMLLVCVSFSLADIVTVKMFGVGLGLAIFIDATLVRALLVPALMRIMGRLNWWAPSFLRSTRKPLSG